MWGASPIQRNDPTPQFAFLLSRLHRTPTYYCMLHLVNQQPAAIGPIRSALYLEMLSPTYVYESASRRKICSGLRSEPGNSYASNWSGAAETAIWCRRAYL